MTLKFVVFICLQKQLHKQSVNSYYVYINLCLANFNFTSILVYPKNFKNCFLWSSFANLYCPFGVCDGCVCIFTDTRIFFVFQGLVSRASRRSSSKWGSSTAPAIQMRINAALSSWSTRTSSWRCKAWSELWICLKSSMRILPVV